MTWFGSTVAAFDVESTGVDVFADRVVTASLVVFEPGADPVVRSWLADPGIDIPEDATKVHGITTAHARQAESFERYLRQQKTEAGEPAHVVEQVRIPREWPVRDVTGFVTPVVFAAGNKPVGSELP